MPRSTRPGDDGATALDAEDVFNRHQERLVARARPASGCNSSTAFISSMMLRVGRIVRVVAGAVHGRQRAAADDRNVVAGEALLGEQLAQLQLDEVQQFRVVHLVDLVHVDDHAGHLHLLRQQDVLAGLGHRALRRRDDQDSAVHLGSAGDHVLDVVGVTRAVHVRVVPVLRLVLDVRDGDGDTARALFRRVVDAAEVAIVRELLQGQHLGDGRGQRRLAVVNVADGADVDVRLRPLEFLLGHVLATPPAPSWLEGSAAVFRPAECIVAWPGAHRCARALPS